jgi:translation initiation factor IF-3
MSLVSKEIRLIDDEGEQVGIVNYDEARKRAQAAKLDLVLVAEKSDPAVCRIMDFGKLCYEQKKVQRNQKKHVVTQKLKEVKFHVNIDEHDYGYKLKHSVEFLEKGFKLKVTLVFRGREMAHKEIGFELVERITNDLKKIGTTEDKPKLLGRNVSLTFSPIGKK